MERDKSVDRMLLICEKVTSILNIASIVCWIIVAVALIAGIVIFMVSVPGSWILALIAIFVFLLIYGYENVL